MNMNMNIAYQFSGIWSRLKSEKSLDAMTAEKVREWAIARKLDVLDVEERKIGFYHNLNCIVLSVAGGKACFPKIGALQQAELDVRFLAAEKEAAIWKKLEWFAPFWIPRGDVDKLLVEAEHCTKARAIELFNYHTSTIYTLAFQAVCIEQLMPCAHSLKEFVPLAREAYLGFYSGYRASSIAALIPIIEGGLTRIVPAGNDKLTTVAIVNRAIDKAIQTAADLHYEHMWVPQKFKSVDYLFVQDERVFIFETFRRWLLQSFFQNTGEYDGVTWLNRHLFAHGSKPDWTNSSNFTRLVVALATLGVIESWHDESNAVSLFFPEMNEDSTLLFEQAKFKAHAQMVLKAMEEKEYHQKGRIVPPLPTDDGVMLRKALLSDDCIKDLVRPLREAGWFVTVSEPDDQALYMTVIAECGEDRFTVALLYSCATSNKLYKTLASSSSAILYRGAPYHQESYARGITVHVGPVAAWQPPKANIA